MNELSIRLTKQSNMKSSFGKSFTFGDQLIDQ